MIILVGGNGFLGRNVRAILPPGSDVVVVTRDVEAARSGRMRTSEILLDQHAFAGDEGDALIKQARAIVFLATLSVPMTVGATAASEIEGLAGPAARFFMRCAALATSARVVLASSGGTIYGNAYDAPIAEGMATRPVSAYGFGKLLLEETLRFIGRNQGLSYGILRISNAVGPHHLRGDQGLVPIAIRLAATGGVLHVRGDGHALRDYVHSRDVAQAILLASASDAPNGRTWNVGSGIGHSTWAVIKTVERVVGRSVLVSTVPASPNDASYAVLDRSLIQAELGWAPEATLGDAVADVWDEMQSRK